MKQWLKLFVALFIIIFSGIWEIRYLNNSVRYVLSDLEYSKNLVQNSNFALANENIEKIEDSWKNIKTVWAIFVDHDEIGYIEERILKYKSELEVQDKNEALVAAKELERIFYHIIDKQSVKIENII